MIYISLRQARTLNGKVFETGHRIVAMSYKYLALKPAEKDFKCVIIYNKRHNYTNYHSKIVKIILLVLIPKTYIKF